MKDFEGKHALNASTLPRAVVSLGAFLRQYRTQHGLTQTELAKRLDMSSATLCDLEKGRSSPSPKRAMRLAQKLEVSARQILEMALQDQLSREQLPFQVALQESRKSGQ